MQLKLPVYSIKTSPNWTPHDDAFLNGGYVAIGWPGIGDLTNIAKKYEEDEDFEKLKAEIKPKLEKEESITNAIQLGLVTGHICRFLTIKAGDIMVISPAGQKIIYICEVTSPYSYHKDRSDDHTAHRIGFNKHTMRKIPLNESKFVTSPFKHAVQNQQTLISMNKYAQQIEDLIRS